MSTPAKLRVQPILKVVYRLWEAQESLQGEMLQRLTEDLKERLLSEGMLNKMVLINIAAEAYAASKRPGKSKLT